MSTSQYQPSGSLVMENTPGQAVTLHGFVIQSHEYLNANKDEISKCEDEYGAD